MSRALLALFCCASIALGASASASADAVPGFSGSWVDRAIGLQYELGSDVPLRNAPFIGTHNSFNSAAEMGPSLSAMDSNQRLNLVDQLDSDVRSIELDLHRFPSAQGGSYTPVVCHALGGGIGCSIEKDLGPVLDELSGWLREPANSDQVVLLYLEDDLQTDGTHDDAAAEIQQRIGDLVYRPPAGAGCTEVPYDVTRDQVRAAGKQVVIVSGCGKGEAWQSYAYSWGEHKESRPMGFEDYPSCGPDYDRTQYDSRLIRYFEDSTRVSQVTGETDEGITPDTAAAMARCGVDLLGLDQFTPTDGRLESLVWSWAPGQPAQGGCALNRMGGRLRYGRWISKACGSLRRRPACRRGDAWLVPRELTTVRRAKHVCRHHRAHFAVPRTGYENQLLRAAMKKHHTRSALLGYRLRDGAWTPLDRRR